MLYDLKNKKAIYYGIFDFEFCNKNPESNQWTFKVPKEDLKYSLLLYAGIPGRTKNVGVEYRGIKVSLLN